MCNTTPEIERLLEKFWQFIVDNRGNGKAFNGWEKEMTISILRADMLATALLYYVDENNNVLGLVHGEANWKKKVFRVTNILCVSNKQCISGFLKMFDIMYPEFKLAGQRYGKEKVYDTPRFKLKFTKESKN